jgi:dUTP pyrophosphatase
MTDQILKKLLLENPDMYKTSDPNWIDPGTITASLACPIKVNRLNYLAVIAQYQTKGAAGMDLHSTDQLVIKPGERTLVGTGLSIQLPKGFEAQIRSRSGLAIKQGIVCLNSPGTIDSDYTGEIKVILMNHSQEPFLVKVGERVAQMVVARVEQATFFEVKELEFTERGSGGFGSTGK